MSGQERAPKPFRNLSEDSEGELTTVIGLKGIDGVVIACDSQTSYSKGIKMKKLNANKIYPIGKTGQLISFALAGAGDADHVGELAEELTRRIAGKSFNDLSFRDEVMTILLDLHKKYNVDRSRFLGLPEVENYFTPIGVLGARLQESASLPASFGLYLLRPDGWIAPRLKYETVGTGGTFADFILQEFEASLPEVNTSWEALDIDTLSLLAPIFLNRVKESDMFSGGRTREAIIDKNGFRELPRTELEARIGQLRSELNNQYAGNPSIAEVWSKLIKKAIEQS